MDRSQRRPEEPACPVESAVSVIGGKWKVLILWYLQEQGAMRFAALQRALEGIRHKMLTQQLRELERDGVITRTVYADTPPRVEYALSEFGTTLDAPLAALCKWGELWLAQSNPEVREASRQSA